MASSLTSRLPCVWTATSESSSIGPVGVVPLRLAQDEEAPSSKPRWEKSRGSGRRAANKRAERPGGFKSVFANNPLLVYGTRGDDEAKRWSLAKARYDAMLFLYRGAGRLEMVADTEFTLTKELGRNVVLYGSASTNKSLKALFGRSPVKVTDGQVDVGLRPEQGEDLGVLLVRPRPGSPTASIALVGGNRPGGQTLDHSVALLLVRRGVS